MGFFFLHVHMFFQQRVTQLEKAHYFKLFNSLSLSYIAVFVEELK
jgi:hypothetical protein